MDHLRPFLGGNARWEIHRQDIICGIPSPFTPDEEKLFRILSQDVEVLDLSVRAMNCLNNANIKLIGELCLKSEARMLKYRNFGKKSLDEIIEKLAENNLQLGMKFSEELTDAIQAEAERAKAVKKEEA